MSIVGIAGRKRSGKDTAARYWVERGYVRLAFADPLKWLVMHTWDLTFDQLYGDCRETVDERWGLSPRVILQRVGTQVAREVHPDTWARKLVQTIRRAESGEEIMVPDLDAGCFVPLRLDSRHGCRHGWVIPDLRFPNEVRVLRESFGGGVRLVKVIRHGLDGGDLHESESLVSTLDIGDVIVNDGTVGDLHVKCSRWWGDL
jgi:hypothetical protein